jgi:hypothetical protein
MRQEGYADGATFPDAHGHGNALVRGVAPAGEPEMEPEATIYQGSEDVGQKLNYNVGHP